MAKMATYFDASLTRVASLRRLFDQERMALSRSDAASPASAGLRAAAASALSAVSEPVFEELTAARKAANKAVDDMIDRNQIPVDCINARLLLCSLRTQGLKLRVTATPRRAPAGARAGNEQDARSFRRGVAVREGME